ncbi:CocE/NonD family hydrolase [Rhodoplanes roseus]|nr:CocE/NonD family hydrolase [Rhodoplanes roseus]
MNDAASPAVGAPPVETVVEIVGTARGPNMIFQKDVPVPVGDGLVLRANVFRPEGEGRFPVVMAHGLYGKDVHFADGFAPQWERLAALHPDLFTTGTSGRFLRWETVDPEVWVPDGFVVVQVDSRGSGKSPGYLDPRSPREIQDYHDAIEWAGKQPWSNGKVGLIGISYYAFTQWAVAALQPPHLAAIVPWEGFLDYYRDAYRHGGIFSDGFTSAWWPRQVLVNQHGNGETRYRDRDTGLPNTGPALSPAMLESNRTDYVGEFLRHPLFDEWYRERAPDPSRITVPVLSAGNWGGPGLHLRGNIDGFLGAASEQKWLSVHDGTHFESFYLPEYVALQKRFFDRFLKGEANGFDDEPRVKLSIRSPHGSVRRGETEFPLARTRWTALHLDAASRLMRPEPPAKEGAVSYEARGEGVDFSTPPMESDTEITGFVSARLWIASSTTDMDIFAVLRAFGPDGSEVIFDGAHERTPVSRGWLRASHRRLDPMRSRPYRPVHAHDRIETLEPGRSYAVDIEIWPTSLMLPKGYRLVLTLMGHDFEYPGLPGRMRHDHPQDRGRPEFSGTCTILTGGTQASTLLLPIIPD